MTLDSRSVSTRPTREEVMSQECGAGSVSESILHDLRSPLAAIYGASEMLVNSDLSPDHIKRLAGNIYGASRRIQALLQELLSNSRGESKGPERCRLDEIASAAWESLSAPAASSGAILAVEIQPEIEVHVERSRMERAFANLIGNAIEAMPEGGEIRISGQFISGSVVVHVDDSGPGVAPEIRSKLFQPFVTAGKRQGLGLGLAFTRQTALDYGGDLWVDTAPGGGARFSLRLPGVRVVEPQAFAVGAGSYACCDRHHCCLPE